MSEVKSGEHAPTLRSDIDDALPDVLILGDSISIGYTPVVTRILADSANIYRPETNCGSSVVYLEHLNEWLDGKKWDVIHFNCGLHDINRNNNEAINRAGERRVSIDEYQENLQKITDMIKSSTKTAIWASTTPVPSEASSRVVGDEVEYNKVAEPLMFDKGISINDLYSFILPHTPECHPALNNVHYTETGYEKLGAKVAEVIMKTLSANSLLKK